MEKVCGGVSSKSCRTVISSAVLWLLMGCALAPGTGYRSTPSNSVFDSSEKSWSEISPGQMRIVVSSDRAYLYVLRDHESGGEMDILGGESFDSLGRVPVGKGPIALEVEGTTGYVANFLSDDVTVVDLKNKTVRGTIQVGNRPIRMATSAQSPYLFVSNYGSDTLSVIDKGTLKTIQTLSVGRRPGDMSVDSNKGVLYLLNKGEGTLSVVSQKSLEVMNTVPVGEFPSGMAISGDGRILYISDADTGNLKWIETENLTSVRNIPVGNRPMQVLHPSLSEAVYVINSGSNSISLVDPDSHELIENIPLDNSPRCITASADGRVLYVSYGQEYGGITLIDLNGQTSWSSKFVHVGS